MNRTMSYVLYTSIARAGGIDLLLGLDSFTRAPDHPLARRSQRRWRLVRRLQRRWRLAGLRRRSGRALIAAGGTLIGWGRRWAPPAGSPALKLVAE